MFASLKRKVGSLLTKEEKKPEPLSYNPVPFTLALSKRKYEEEQYAKYGLKKERAFSLDEIE